MEGKTLSIVGSGARIRLTAECAESAEKTF